MLKPWASFFTLHCSSSLSYINEYLAIDSGGQLDMCMSSLRALIVWMLSREDMILTPVTVCCDSSIQRFTIFGIYHYHYIKILLNIFHRQLSLMFMELVFNNLQRTFEQRNSRTCDGTRMKNSRTFSKLSGTYANCYLG